MQKEKKIKKLSDIEGKNIQSSVVPDYIDGNFAKKKNIFIETNQNKKPNKTGKNSKNGSKPNKKVKKTNTKNGKKKK